MNPDKIENNDLRRLIESHPEATLQTVIEYC